MAEFDLIVRGGTVVTASDQFAADIGIRAGRIAAIADRLEGGPELDASGLLVLPGGVDSHCHIEQLKPGGGSDEETFTTGSTAALAGGTTSVVTFSAQFKGGGRAGAAGRIPPPGRVRGDGGLRVPPDHHRPDRRGDPARAA